MLLLNILYYSLSGLYWMARGLLWLRRRRYRAGIDGWCCDNSLHACMEFSMEIFKSKTINFFDVCFNIIEIHYLILSKKE